MTEYKRMRDPKLCRCRWDRTAEQACLYRTRGWREGRYRGQKDSHKLNRTNRIRSSNERAIESLYIFSSFLRRWCSRHEFITPLSPSFLLSLSSSPRSYRRRTLAVKMFFRGPLHSLFIIRFLKGLDTDRARCSAPPFDIRATVPFYPI